MSTYTQPLSEKFSYKEKAAAVDTLIEVGKAHLYEYFDRIQVYTPPRFKEIEPKDKIVALYKVSKKDIALYVGISKEGLTIGALDPKMHNDVGSCIFYGSKNRAEIGELVALRLLDIYVKGERGHTYPPELITEIAEKSGRRFKPSDYDRVYDSSWPMRDSE